MSATIITAGIVGILITVLLLVWVNQWRQRNNDAKRLRISHLASQVKRYEALAQSIPAQYIEPKIHLLLLQAATQAVQQLTQLQPAKARDAQLAELAALEKQVSAGKTIAPTIDTGNEKAGKELRQDLQSLFAFIKQQAKSGHLDKQYANQQLIKTQRYRSESLANAHSHQACAAEKTQKFRLAIHHLHDAIEALAKTPAYPVAEQKIAVYQQRIAQLEVLASQQSMAKTGVTTQAAENNLSNQLEQQNDADSKWKKLQDYQE